MSKNFNIGDQVGVVHKGGLLRTHLMFNPFEKDGVNYWVVPGPSKIEDGRVIDSCITVSETNIRVLSSF